MKCQSGHKNKEARLKGNKRKRTVKKAGNEWEACYKGSGANGTGC